LSIAESLQAAIQSSAETGDEEEPETLAYAQELAQGSLENRELIDTILGETVEGWSLGQMAKTDLAVLRVVLYELIFTPVPATPLIESAIRIAHRYGGERSGGFVNGVLARILHRVEAGEIKTSAKEEEWAS
jgi:N utilization substance protein B